jgi:uncharacterized membrane protein YphA (DoxX/SURF4 family)
MRHAIDATPSWVEATLDWRWVWVAARIGLTSAYLVGGVTKLLNYSAAIAEQESFGLHPGWLWASATIIVELVGPALVISGRLVWLGAGALGVLTAIATLVANNFWTMQGHDRFVATNTFFEHIGLIAAFVLVAALAQVEREGRSRKS